MPMLVLGLHCATAQRFADCFTRLSIVSLCIPSLSEPKTQSHIGQSVSKLIIRDTQENRGLTGRRIGRLIWTRWCSCGPLGLNVQCVLKSGWSEGWISALRVEANIHSLFRVFFPGRRSPRLRTGKQFDECSCHSGRVGKMPSPRILLAAKSPPNIPHVPQQIVRDLEIGRIFYAKNEERKNPAANWNMADEKAFNRLAAEVDATISRS